MHDLTRRPRRVDGPIEASCDPAGRGRRRSEATRPDSTDGLNVLLPAARRFRTGGEILPGQGLASAGLDRVRAELGALRRTVSIHTPDGRPADNELVVARLEEAGATLLALPESGYSPRMRSGALQVVHSAAEAYGWSHARLRPPTPSPERITRMDETFAWLTLIPADRTVLRRLVGARALVSPLTGKHLYAWRRLGAVVGADHKAVQRWHAEGIRLIVRALNRM